MTTSGITRRGALRMFGIGALGVAGAGALGACAPSGAGTSSGGDTKSKNFDFTSWSLNEEAAKPSIEKIIAAWEKAEGSKIRAVSYPYNEYLSQLTLKLGGGETTGAVHLDIAWLAAVAQMGKLADLGSVALKGGYTNVALDSGMYDGKQYGLPWNTGSIGVIANSSLLEKAGIKKHPTTVEEFEGALRELKGLGGGVVPYAAATKVAQLKDIFPWMQTFGCTLLEDSKVTIGDDASIDAVTWYKKLHDEKLIAADVDRFDARALFGQGKAAFYDDAIIGKGVTAAQSKDKTLADAMRPMKRPVLRAGDTPQALLWGGVIAIVKGKGQDAATEFALHTTTDRATTTEYFAARALPPSTTAGLSDPKVAQDTFTTEWTEKITDTATGSPFWQFAQNAQIEEAVAKQVQAVLVGTSKPKDAMKKAAEEVNDLIKR
ncbi:MULTISPECIES: extracellular solute-binding protein [unclassified Streptomyces]|uniref:extracellular solute-binding protein n=1 Tax=unclassified Streptomyces TaxID=2593676 RepID=UPI00081B380C|nr:MULTISPECIES: extracellular solute-binding protein [unclassified Streptomyces]MYQ88170.1 extracellular solute-binding protein [Streptomyces sp. SID4936]SCE53519.1 carbohydrate ABC transporter substrate-binding protein, CUT1 family [Streptomyces sp. DvalAA-43]